MSAFDDLLAGISNPAITAERLRLTATPLKQVDLALPLMPFQREAVDHALRDSVTMPYSYLGLEMGLGKTPCGVAVAAASEAAGQTPVGIVVPPSMRTTWLRELKKFAPWLTVALIEGTKPYDLPEVDVIVMGDSSIDGWAEHLVGKLAALIVDEAHRFKNHSAKRTKALTMVAESVPGIRMPMSGTPTPNGRHAELASQVDLMGGKAWTDIGGKGTFWHHYCPKVDQFSRGNNDGPGLNRAMESTWFYRRLRSEVIELPAKGRTSLAMCGLGRPVKEYIAAETDLIAWLASKQDGKVTKGQERAEALIRLTSLRKLAGEAKVKATIAHVKDILDNEPGGVFVVAEHSDVMDDLMMGLQAYNPSNVRGGMSDKQKAEAVDDFCDGTSRVLVGQIIAAGVGLTLHGGGINHRVVVVQLPWTPADLKQAEDRLHRIGQTHDVMVEVALCAIDDKWTIDERLWGILESKNFDATTVTDGNGEYLIGAIVDGLLDTYRS